MVIVILKRRLIVSNVFGPTQDILRTLMMYKNMFSVLNVKAAARREGPALGVP